VWYLDRTHKRLYLIRWRPENASVVLATLTQPLVKVNGAKHVKFVEFVFEYGHGDGLAVAMQGCRDRGLRGRNFASTRISMNGSNNAVRSCDLFNLGRGGIHLNGGDRKTLTAGKNLAENNHIPSLRFIPAHVCARIGVQGCGNIARHNCIHDAPHNAVCTAATTTFSS
jgi:hypothetical protein